MGPQSFHSLPKRLWNAQPGQLYASKYMHYRLTQYFLVFSKSTNIFNTMSLDEIAYFELIYYVWIVGGLILPMRSRRLTRLSTSAKEVAL